MQVIDPGHKYSLDSGIISDNSGGQGAFTLEFMKKDAGGTQTDGTTNEEVLSALIDRLQYLQSKVPCRENAIVITKLEECLMWLNKRTAERVTRGVEGTNQA